MDPIEEPCRWHSAERALVSYYNKCKMNHYTYSTPSERKSSFEFDAKTVLCSAPPDEIGRCACIKKETMGDDG